MSGSLDQFFGTLPQRRQTTAQEERCANPQCRAILKGIKYTIKRKGEEKTYCQTCAKKILRPQETVESI